MFFDHAFYLLTSALMGDPIGSWSKDTNVKPPPRLRVCSLRDSSGYQYVRHKASRAAFESGEASWPATITTLQCVVVNCGLREATARVDASSTTPATSATRLGQSKPFGDGQLVTAQGRRRALLAGQ